MPDLRMTRVPTGRERARRPLWPGHVGTVMAAMVLFGSLADCRAQDPPRTKTAVEHGDLVANLYRPEGEGPFPAVVAIGGSGGGIGWQDKTAELLARHGFVAMALAYFGMDGVPSHLDRIPLEYFQEAISYLASRPFVDAERIGTVGVSKGGELVLVLGSHDPRVRAVVAFVPSSVVFQSIGEGWPVTSSWTKGDEELPFVPYRITDNFQGRLVVLYTETLEQVEEVEKAVIEVERTRGPILLLSGEDDEIWPSTAMSELVAQRLTANDFPYEFQHVAYPEAGHRISTITEPTTRSGGTEEGNRRAQEDARQRMLDFLTEHLHASSGD